MALLAAWPYISGAITSFTFGYNAASAVLAWRDYLKLQGQLLLEQYTRTLPDLCSPRN